MLIKCFEDSSTNGSSNASSKNVKNSGKSFFISVIPTSNI